MKLRSFLIRDQFLCENAQTNERFTRPKNTFMGTRELMQIKLQHVSDEFISGCRIYLPSSAFG